MYIEDSTLTDALAKEKDIVREWKYLQETNPNIIQFVEMSLDLMASKVVHADFVSYDDACNVLKNALLSFNYLVEMQLYKDGQKNEA